MKDPPFDRFLASPLFTIVSAVAGEERKEYTIHSALLASMSPALKRLVEGDMIEASERRVSWDADNRTLALFCEFAYTGSYSIMDKREHEAQETDVVNVQTKRTCTITAAPGSRERGWTDEDEDDDVDYEDEAASETTSLYNEEHESPEDVANDLHPPFSNSRVEIYKTFLIELTQLTRDSSSLPTTME